MVTVARAIGWPGLNLTIEVIMAQARSRFSERNNIQPMLTNKKVASQDNCVGICRANLKALSMAKPMPCHNPQNIKCQAAPCHKPDRANTMIIFKKLRTGPLRFPPKGIYT